jgi:hypothetical protein
MLGAASELRKRDFPPEWDERESMAERAFGIGGALLTINPALAQIFPLRLGQRARSDAPEVVVWTMCKASAHAISFSSRTNNTKRPSLFIYVWKGLFVLA